MTLRTVTPVLMVANTRTADMVAGADLSATIATGDTFVITPVLRTYDMFIFVSFAGTTTLTFDAGDEPASMRASMGTTTMAGANAEVRGFFLAGGQFMQMNSTGIQTVTGSNLGSNCKMGVYLIPRLNS